MLVASLFFAVSLEGQIRGFSSAFLLGFLAQKGMCAPAYGCFRPEFMLVQDARQECTCLTSPDMLTWCVRKSSPLYGLGGICVGFSTSLLSRKVRNCLMSRTQRGSWSLSKLRS
ncbi:uncharacterized protein EV420DRAFT_1567970 [Desarmillaria tabescens]|uniref:Uncharacterized protein n=1 Tax=Armillaria tabescens TaxID=1929756 RepID=A0AA39MVZ6_ARMTA|nr:uncharacterized protein EV420DRAFT_1567970 [Desarmillaria tabescens]KAK0447860.1 hypothetical protein EV420DRAFT_1567970 [Desarmillaria tabescens]